MQDTQINTFTGGLDSDSDLRSVADSRYIDAANVDIYSVDSNSRKSISPLRGTEIAISPTIVSTQVQTTRVAIDVTANRTYSFSFYDGASLKTGSFTTTGINANSRYSSFLVLLAAQLGNLGYFIIPSGSAFPSPAAAPQNGYTYFSISRLANQAVPVRVNISWAINGVDYETVVLQEAYDLHSLDPIASYAIEDLLFIWSQSSDEDIIELGITGSNSKYTRLFRTWRWHFPVINPEAIDIRMESVSNNQWAMYITDNYNKPKVFYIQKDYSEDCLLKYTTTNWSSPTDGYLIYNYADEQTNLQLINNAGLVTFSDQLQVGGSLLSGGYRYSVRFGVNGAENTTEWSVLSPNAIPVFKTGIDAPSAYIRIQGDKSGEVTSKCNVLLVQNCMPNVFNYVELAAIIHAGTAVDAKIIGKYPITGSSMTITHTGNETGVQTLDYRLLPQTEPVIKTAKTLEIKKNRFNIANVSIGADDPALASIASGSTIAAARYETDGVGLFAPKAKPYLIGTTTGVQWLGTPIDFVATTAPISYDVDSGVWTPIISPSTPPYIDESGTYDISITIDKTILTDKLQITKIPTNLPASGFSAAISYSLSYFNGTRNVSFTFLATSAQQFEQQLTQRFAAENIQVSNFRIDMTSPNRDATFTIGEITYDSFTGISNGVAPIGLNFTYKINGVVTPVTILQMAYNSKSNPRYIVYLYQGTTVVSSTATFLVSKSKINTTITVVSPLPVYVVAKATQSADGTIATSASFAATLNITRVSAIENDFKDTKAGEYQLPENCANRVGYMLNEKYPIFMRFHYKNGYISSPFYVGIFDNLDNWEIDGRPDSRKLTTLITESNQYKTFIYHLTISGVNISSIKSQLNGVSIWRGVCNPTVLGSGMVFPADDINSNIFKAGYYASIPQGSGYYGNTYGTTSISRRYGMFFSHDTRLAQLNPQAGDFIRYWSPPTVFNSNSDYEKTIDGTRFQGGFAEYSGCTYDALPTSQDIGITDGRYVDFDEALGDFNVDAPTIESNLAGNRLFYKPSINVTSGTSGSMSNMSLGFNDYMEYANFQTDNGAYMAQYVRSLTAEAQYDINSIDLVPTGTYVAIDEFSPDVINGISVFGGDTYTQKNILKIRYWSNYNASDPVRTSFITFYAQSKINTQLFYCNQSEDVSPTRNLQGWKSIISYLFPFETISEVAEEQFNYDEGYSAPYPLPIKAYDSSVPSESKFVSRIYYSQQKPINSVQDFYRKINALDFRDLDTKNGEIVALRDVNNYMVSVQPRAVSVLPYLSDVAIGTQGGGEILVGTGGVYNQRENIISTYGSTFQTCVYVGQNNNGNSQLYWFSPAFKKYCRYGADGIRILSDEQAMRTYFLGINSVEKEYDMIQVYDPKYATQIMTFRTEGIKYTLFYNENVNNFSTFATFRPSRYFLLNNQSYAVHNGSIWKLFTGGYLNFFGSLYEFNIKFVANKGVLNDKRFLSTAISVGTGYSFTDPTVSMSVSSPSAFPHIGTLAEKRWDNFFVAFAKAAGQQPIGQFGIVEVKTSAYIELMGAVTKWRGIFRGLFK